MKKTHVTDIRSYIFQLSPRLDKFEQVRPDLFRCRCPVCGDSKKDPDKKRFYIYRKGEIYSVKCHNCQYTARFMSFMKQHFPVFYNQAALDKYIPEKKPSQAPALIKPTKSFTNLSKFIDLGYDYKGTTRISDLPNSHIAVKTLTERMIPVKWWTKHFFYVENFVTYLAEIGEHEQSKKYEKYKDERLIIPFYTNDTGESFVFQARALDPDAKLRYITIKKDKEDLLKVWGMDRINPKLPVIVVEGPIDAMFLPNTIAMAGSMAHTPPGIRKIFVLDNEPRSRDMYNIYMKLIRKGETVSFFDGTIKEKDINQMIMAGYKPNQLLRMIFKNACTGLRASLKLEEWKK